MKLLPDIFFTRLKMFRIIYRRVLHSKDQILTCKKNRSEYNNHVVRCNTQILEINSIILQTED